MNYSIPALLCLSVLGILMHNLLKLNALNRANDGKLDFKKYIQIEIFSILLSFCFCIVALIVRSEIFNVKGIDKWQGFTFVAIGYMAQSIIATFGGKAQKFLDNQNKDS